MVEHLLECNIVENVVEVVAVEILLHLARLLLCAQQLFSYGQLDLLHTGLLHWCPLLFADKHVFRGLQAHVLCQARLSSDRKWHTEALSLAFLI